MQSPHRRRITITITAVHGGVSKECEPIERHQLRLDVHTTCVIAWSTFYRQCRCFLIPRASLNSTWTSVNIASTSRRVIQNSNNYYSLCDECWRAKKRFEMCSILTQEPPKFEHHSIIRCSNDFITQQSFANIPMIHNVTCSHLIDVASPLP